MGDFDSMFAAEYPAVLRTVFLICHDIQQAQDVTQDAFVELLRHWDKVSRYDRPGAWVRRVAIRKMLKAMRREVRRRAGRGRLRATSAARAGRPRRAAGRPRPAAAAAHRRGAVLLRGPPAARRRRGARLLAVDGGRARAPGASEARRAAEGGDAAMDVESRLDQALERGGQTVQPDVPGCVARRTPPGAAQHGASDGPAWARPSPASSLAAGRRGEDRRTGRRRLGGPGESAARDRDVGRRLARRSCARRSAESLGPAQAAQRRRGGRRPDLRHRHLPAGRRAEPGPRGDPDLGRQAALGAGAVPAGPGVASRWATTGRVYVADTGNFRIQVFTRER